MAPSFMIDLVLKVEQGYTLLLTAMPSLTVINYTEAVGAFRGSIAVVWVQST